VRKHGTRGGTKKEKGCGVEKNNCAGSLEKYYPTRAFLERAIEILFGQLKHFRPMATWSGLGP
jgi:hypothetical protein